MTVALGISFKDEDLAQIDAEVAKRRRVDGSSSRSSVVRTIVREYFTVNGQPVIRVRHRDRREANDHQG